MEDFSKELTTYGFTALRTFNKIGSFNYSPIYHYTSANGLLGILDKDNIKLWFTQYDCLNDKNERIDALNTLIEYCEDKYKNKVISEELLLKIKDIKMSDDITVLNEICEPIVVGSGETIESYTEMAIDESYTYLCCFSTNPDSLSMWNYYSKSKNYEGYSIGISHVHFYTPNEKERKYELYLKKVVYTKKEKYELFDEYLLPLLKLYDSDTPINKIRTLNMITTSINFVQFIFKNEHFKHEEEIRAILRVSKKFTSDKRVSERKFRESNGYIAPYVELSLPKTDLVEVYTAPLFEKGLAKTNLKSLLEQREYLKTDVISSTVPIRF